MVNPSAYGSVTPPVGEAVFLICITDPVFTKAAELKEHKLDVAERHLLDSIESAAQQIRTAMERPRKSKRVVTAHQKRVNELFAELETIHSAVKSRHIQSWNEHRDYMRSRVPGFTINKDVRVKKSSSQRSSSVLGKLFQSFRNSQLR